MKRARPPRSSDSKGDQPAAASNTTMSSSNSPSPASNGGTKRRRNNPDECCLTCKLRKVKCSGKLSNNPCDNCARLKLDCSFTQSLNSTHSHDKVVRITPNGTVTEAGTLRKRAQRACQQCHMHKTKCSGDLPRCLRCQHNDLPCEYMPSKRKFANLPKRPVSANAPVTQVISPPANDQASQDAVTEASSPSSLENLAIPSPAYQHHLMKRDVLLKHVDFYFEHLFHMPCMGFLHPATVYRSIQEDKLPAPLAAGICAITAEFLSPGEAGRSMSARWNEQVEFHVLRNFAFMDRELLVYHVLATIYNWMSGPLSKVWMWTSTASRLIKCLQLNYEPDTRAGQETYPEREIQRRSVWKIYIIDHFLSGGHDEHLLLPSNALHIRLPCADRVFMDEQPSTMETLDKNPMVSSIPGDYSLDACHVRLLSIRSKILRATKQFTDASGPALSDPMRPERFMEHVNNHQIALNRFSDSLPPNLRLSVANVDAHLHRPDRASFTMLHTWFCQTHIELYSFSLQALKESTPDSLSWDFFLRSQDQFIFRCQQQAVSYAICLAQTWDYCHANIKKGAVFAQGLVTVDWMVGACAVDVIDVLLVARKHKLYENLRGNTSAQMCYMKPINDELLGSLIDSLTQLVNDLATVLPRVEHYRTVIQAKLKEFDGGASSNAYGGLVKREDHEVATTSPGLPGPGDMMPDAQLNADGPAGAMGEASSISERFLRKKSTSNDKLQSQNGMMPNFQLADPPMMPYCLRQARGSPAGGPFAAPTAGNYPPPYDATESMQQPPMQQQHTPSHHSMISQATVFESPVRTTLPPEVAVANPMAFGQYPMHESTTPTGMTTPMVPSHTDMNVWVPYGSPCSWVHDQPHGGHWMQQHGRAVQNVHGYT